MQHRSNTALVPLTKVHAYSQHYTLILILNIFIVSHINHNQLPNFICVPLLKH